MSPCVVGKAENWRSGPFSLFLILGQKDRIIYFGSIDHVDPNSPRLRGVSQDLYSTDPTQEARAIKRRKSTTPLPPGNMSYRSYISYRSYRSGIYITYISALKDVDYQAEIDDL